MISTTPGMDTGIRRRKQRQPQFRELNHHHHPTATAITRSYQQRRKLTGYCGWKIWNATTNASQKKTCDQIAVELASSSTIKVAQAKSQILTQGCICEVGETSFLDDSILNLAAFCGQCQYKNADFVCDDRVEFVMRNYPEDNPTTEQARMNLLKKGDCLDRNWAPYADTVNNNSGGGGGGGGGLTGGAIAGIVIAALALCGASMIGFCILRDWKKVMSDEERDKQLQEAASSAKKKELNVIEEGDENEEDDDGESGVDFVSSAAAAAPQSREDGDDGMEDDQTEIIANHGNRGTRNSL